MSTPVSSTVAKAKFRFRHAGLLIGFVAFVGIPTALAAFYMLNIADDQYSSRVSFSIRSEEAVNPLEALSGLGQLSSGTSSDASILNEYLRSQNLVEDVLKQIDLRELYSKPEFDPIFAFDPDLVLEDLVSYFQRMNVVTFDSSNGLLDIESFAFTAEDAQTVSSVILEVSSELVERLSQVAEDDITRDAEFELQLARERLFEARKQISIMRGREQTVDPLADLESQMGVLTALQNQLATVLVEYDLLISGVGDSDPRVTAVLRRIDAIERRVQEERNKLGRASRDDTDSLARVIGDFESLMAEREFAERAYLAANANYDAALAEARRKSKYLVAHIQPTLAQSSQYPNRLLWIFGVFGFLLLVWSVSMLTIYALLDRR